MSTDADLAALGIDSPRTRWFAARDYIEELRDDSVRAVNRVWLIAAFYDFAADNALCRGEEDRPGWGPRMIARDFYEAYARAVGQYTGRAREAAAGILKAYMPDFAQ
jgi:hypothetical protein